MRNMNIYAELAVENVEAYFSDAVAAVKALYNAMLCENECFIIFNDAGVTFTRNEADTKNSVILEEGIDFDSSVLAECAELGLKEEDIKEAIEDAAREIVDALSLF